MRFVLPLVALFALSSAPLRADEFAITLTGNPGSPSGSGTFTTDGTCFFCLPVGIGAGGWLSLTINIGSNSGTAAFDISDDSFQINQTFYYRPNNALFYKGVNSETGDTLGVSPNEWVLTTAAGASIGTYTVTPVPEPSFLLLLMPIVALVGLHWRHQRKRRHPRSPKA